MATLPASQRTLKTRNCIAYGIGDLYGGGSFFIVSTFAMYYLVAIVGMSPILAGLIPGLGKIWDSISDPIMGYITDHTKSRFGRRRVFFLIVIIPIAVSFSLIWVPVRFSNDFAFFLYYFMAYLFFYTTTTVALVPYSALSAEMSRNFKERNKLTGFRMFFSMFATLLAGLFAQPIIQLFGGNTRGHLMMGICFGILFAIPWIFVYLGTWELPVEKTGNENRSIFRNFASMFNNRSFRIHIIMYISAYGAMDILMAWFKFYILDYLHRDSFVTIGLGCILITQILALPLYIKIANKKGHATAYRIGLSLWAAAMLAMIFQTPTTPSWTLIINCIAIGAGLGAGTLIPYQILPFVTDVDELMTGEKRAGIYAGAMTLIRKLIQGALVLPVLGVLLSTIGYLGPVPAAFTSDQLVDDVLPRVALYELNTGVSGYSKLIENAYSLKNNEGNFSLTAVSPEDKRIIRRVFDAIKYKGFGATSQSIPLEQTTSTISILRILFFISPLIFIISGILFSLFFPITPQTHKIMALEVERLAGGGSPSEAANEVKAICKKLSGCLYENLPRFTGQ